MYERLTQKTERGYTAEPGEALERLGRLEDGIERLQQEYARTQEAMDKLTALGKEKTATYQQLRANKMTLRELLLRLGCL